eukprot:scaffold587115_cov32-Prasinocladus_malaysianus.AAC.1
MSLQSISLLPDAYGLISQAMFSAVDGTLGELHESMPRLMAEASSNCQLYGQVRHLSYFKRYSRNVESQRMICLTNFPNC